MQTRANGHVVSAGTYYYHLYLASPDWLSRVKGINPDIITRATGKYRYCRKIDD